MKKKQLLVFIMAGSLAAGMSPVTMAFAEADTQTVTIEDTVAVAAESEEGEAAAEPVQDISDAAADTPVEEPAQAADTPTAEPTQAAADTPAAEPTQAAADTPAAELLFPDGEDHFVFTVHVDESPMFLSWILGFGNKAEILYPDRIKEACKALCRDAGADIRWYIG